MIFLEKPENFNSIFEISSCFFEKKDGTFLILHRQDHKPQGNTWGVPAGKFESGENALQAILRELFEETSCIGNLADMKFFKTVFVRYAEYDFIYHMYSTPFLDNHEIKIDKKAHKDFKWVIPDEALTYNLIQDLDECIKLYYFNKTSN